MVGILLVLVAVIGAPLLVLAMANGSMGGLGDEYFADAIPGELPHPGAPANRRRGRRAQEMVEKAAVRFHPPDGIRPASVGVISERAVRPRDLGAAFLDLAVRGFFRIRRPDGPYGYPGPYDWLLETPRQAPATPLSAAERHLLQTVFPHDSQVLLSVAKPQMRSTLAGLRAELDQEAADRGWFPHRTASGLRLSALVGVGGLALVIAGGAIGGDDLPGWLIPLALLSVGASALVPALSGRRPRSAEGTAVAVQVEGFRRYIATAEARQLRFEEAAGIFSRYLPWAIAFNLTEHWCQVFRDVVAAAHASGDSAVFGGYVGATDTWGSDLAWLGDTQGSLGSVASDVSGAADSMASGVTDVLNDVTSSVDSLVSEVTSSVAEASGATSDGTFALDGGYGGGDSGSGSDGSGGDSGSSSDSGGGGGGGGGD